MEVLITIFAYVFMGCIGLGIISLGIFIISYPIIEIIQAIKEGLEENKTRNSKKSQKGNKESKQYTFELKDIDDIEINVNIKYKEETKE